MLFNSNVRQNLTLEDWSQSCKMKQKFHKFVYSKVHWPMVYAILFSKLRVLAAKAFHTFYREPNHYGKIY